MSDEYLDEELLPFLPEPPKKLIQVFDINPDVENYEGVDFFDYIPDTTDAVNQEDLEKCSSYTSCLSQLTPPCSDDFILPPICIELCTDTNSALLDDDAYVFEQCHVVDYGSVLAEHYAKVEDLDLHEYNKYLDDCNTYNVTPISALKQIFNGETELDLSGYGSDTLGIRLLANALLGPPILNLTVLDLSYTLFDERACEPLNEFIRNSLTLKTLNFSNCFIGEEGMAILADGISLSPSIEYMNFRNCNLRDIGGAIVAKAMSYNDYCKVLNLSYNKMYTKTGIELNNLLSSNTPLQDLDLSWNELYEHDAVTGILNGLYDNQTLKRLSLAWNGVSTPIFGKLFRRAIKRHPTIEEIDLQDNRLSSAQAKPIALGMRQAKHLQRIYLGHNPWTRDDIMTFARLIKQTSLVKYISFGNDFYVTPEEEDKFNQHKAKDPDLEIIYKAAMMPNPPEPVIFRDILVDRMKFLAQKPKKKRLKRNAGHFMHQLIDQQTETITFDEMHKMVKTFKMKIDKDLIDQTCVEWQKLPKKHILIHDLADYYLARSPTERPPTPPPKKIKKRKGHKEGDKTGASKTPAAPKKAAAEPKKSATASKKPAKKK